MGVFFMADRPCPTGLRTLPEFSCAAQVVILHVGFLRSFNWYA